MTGKDGFNDNGRGGKIRGAHSANMLERFIQKVCEVRAIPAGMLMDAEVLANSVQGQMLTLNVPGKDAMKLYA
jgi:hypothetical protein